MINFISGLIIGGLIVMVLMCLLQINRDNKAQRKIDKAIYYINAVAMKTNSPKFFVKIKDTIWGEELLDILGGDVDDE